MSEGTITVRERDLMYRMIISQLLHDGFHDTAALLSKFVQPVPDCPPSNRLEKVVKLGLRAEPSRKPLTQFSDTVAPASAIDLDFDTEVQTNEPEAAMYETCYVTSHKGACRAAAWSTDGQLIATGSQDASIKILDVERMLAKSSTPAAIQAMENQQQSVESHPVIRTYYDHSEEVTCLEFHPTSPVVISGSKDLTVKFFRYSKSTLKRAFHIIHEVEKIKCMSIHPTGDFILVGTKHPTLRLYDVNSLQCFVSSNPQDQHKGTVLSVKYSKLGNMYVTGSKDGDIKIWDGVSNRCINTFYKAHGGEPVCSVQFSKNGKYVLSSGKDSLVRLWELSTSRTLITYTGAGSDKQRHRNNAVFNHTEDYVMFPDEKTTSLCCWDSRNAERNKLLALGHNGFVRTILHSTTGPGLLTCSDDFRARFWYQQGGD